MCVPIVDDIGAGQLVVPALAAVVNQDPKVSDIDGNGRYEVHYVATKGLPEGDRPPTSGDDT